MEDMRKAAVVFYRRSDENQKQLAKQFFNKMDVDRNGKICPNEFLEALKEVDYDESKQKELAKLFKKLDSNFDKSLDFFETLPFYYLMNQKTALFCSGCSGLLVGEYFSCLDCHVEGTNFYDLCTICYQKGMFNDHIHDNSLYDSSHLLQIYRNLVAHKNANRKVGRNTGSSGLSLGPNTIKPKTKLFCAGCSDPLNSIYFSCIECHLKAAGDTYDLCIDCYDDGAADDHMHKCLCVNNALLQIYRQLVAKWKENKEGTHPMSDIIKITVAGISLVVGPALLIVNVSKLVSDRGSSTSGSGPDGDALGTGSADPSLPLMDTGAGGDYGTVDTDVAEYGSSLADFSDQGSSLADLAQQGWCLADVAQQSSSLADVAQQSSSLADVAQNGSSFADAAQNVLDGADIADAAITILSACLIM